MSRLALFDLDDTLLDGESAFRTWAHHFVDCHNLSESSLETIIRIDLEGDMPVLLFLKKLRAALGIRTSVGELVKQFWAVYPTCFTVQDSTYDALKRLRLSGWTNSGGVPIVETSSWLASTAQSAFRSSSRDPLLRSDVCEHEFDTYRIVSWRD